MKTQSPTRSPYRSTRNKRSDQIRRQVVKTLRTIVTHIVGKSVAKEVIIRGKKLYE